VYRGQPFQSGHPLVLPEIHSESPRELRRALISETELLGDSHVTESRDNHPISLSLNESADADSEGSELRPDFKTTTWSESRCSNR
jgi:hypothetical protein